MLDEYILRGYAISAICRNCPMTDYCRMTGELCEDVKRIIAIPADDVEPVRHGRWISKEGVYGVVYCLICDFELKIDNTPYCPNCGAKMDAEPPKGEDHD